MIMMLNIQKANATSAAIVIPMMISELEPFKLFSFVVSSSVTLLEIVIVVSGIV